MSVVGAVFFLLVPINKKHASGPSNPRGQVQEQVQEQVQGQVQEQVQEQVRKCHEKTVFRGIGREFE